MEVISYLRRNDFKQYVSFIKIYIFVPKLITFNRTCYLRKSFRDSTVLILFFTSTLLVIPPIMTYIYLWVLVLRFYKELHQNALAMIMFAKNETFSNPKVIGKFMTGEEYALSKNFVESHKSIRNHGVPV